MTARTAALPATPVLPTTVEDSAQLARRRFSAIVSTLAAPAQPAQSPLERPDAFEDAPTRRVNRVRRLLGKMPPHGKSRGYARALR